MVLTIKLVYQCTKGCLEIGVKRKTQYYHTLARYKIRLKSNGCVPISLAGLLAMSCQVCQDQQGRECKRGEQEGVEAGEGEDRCHGSNPCYI